MSNTIRQRRFLAQARHAPATVFYDERFLERGTANIVQMAAHSLHAQAALLVVETAGELRCVAAHGVDTADVDCNAGLLERTLHYPRRKMLVKQLSAVSRHTRAPLLGTLANDYHCYAGEAVYDRNYNPIGVLAVMFRSSSTALNRSGDPLRLLADHCSVFMELVSVAAENHIT